MAVNLPYTPVGNHGKGNAGFLENALVRAAPGDLQAVALEAILEVAAAAPADFAGSYRAKAPWLQGFLSHVNQAGELPPLHCPPGGRHTLGESIHADKTTYKC